MNEVLYQMVVERLLASDELESGATDLVDAACRGDEALASALAGELASGAAAGDRPTPRDPGSLPGAYLRSLKVRGFRGIGRETALELQPGPGLTLVVGRNGSGKSSFAEALETALTGACRRWAGRRQKAWAEGWRNFHESGIAAIEATFVVEGSDQPIVIRRSWEQEAALDEGELRVRRGTERLADLDALGWTDALRSFRPLLSYAELGTLLDEPSQLYDSLEAILGLEELGTARDRLLRARKDLDDDAKRVKADAEAIRGELAGIDDPRAEACASALKGRGWDLEELAAGLHGAADDDAHGGLADLRALAALEAPDLARIDAAIGGIREVLVAERELVGTAVDQGDQLAQVLEHALRFHERFEGDCPVCGSALDPGWRSSVLARIEASRKTASEARRVADDRRKHIASLRGAIRPVPGILERVEATGMPDDALMCWRRWADVPADVEALARHAEEHAIALDAALAELRSRALGEVAAREDAWRPVAVRVTAWLNEARGVEANATRLKALKQAEKWMKDTEEELRDQRFEPIAGRSQQIWALLRQESDVDLQRVELEGTKTRRHVKLNVTVDGRDSVALAVMSQGELNALALSLFLPRMTFAESPFRFVVIDDPVQAMDPQKVDGLARVLAEVATTRQVIVLTHDPRLLEAVQRLAIPATAIEVHRRPGSSLELVPRLDAVARHLDDARAVTRSRELSAEVVARVVPGFCRSAVEAASIESIRRRRLGRGDSHASVEDALHSAQGTMPLVALAMFDDEARAGEVFPTLHSSDPRLADALRACKEGAHHGTHGVSLDLIRDTERLAQQLRVRR